MSRLFAQRRQQKSIHLALNLAFFAFFFLSINVAAMSGQTKGVKDTLAVKEDEKGALVANPLVFKSWDSCIAAAEQARSNRDLKFFLSASNLSNAKAWFVSHSRANEEHFCSRILTCEQIFGGAYSEEEGSYQGC